MLLGYGSIGNDLFGKGQPSYNSSIPQRAHDPEMAKSLLKKAGVSHLNLTLPATDLAPGMLESALAFKQPGRRSESTSRSRRSRPAATSPTTCT